MAYSEQVRFIVGSVAPVELHFYDSQDNKQPLVGATAATFEVKSNLDSTAILVKTTAQPANENLDIDENSNKISIYLTQAEADALVPGIYVGDVAIQFSSGWRYTIPFNVIVQKGVSSKL